ncbi:MAG: hypothetical protein ACLRNA_02585, partial [Gemmiger formicilis]
MQTFIAGIVPHQMQDVRIQLFAGLLRPLPNQRLDTYNTEFHRKPTSYYKVVVIRVPLQGQNA